MSHFFGLIFRITYIYMFKYAPSRHTYIYINWYFFPNLFFGKGKKRSSPSPLPQVALTFKLFSASPAKEKCLEQCIVQDTKIHFQFQKSQFQFRMSQVQFQNSISILAAPFLPEPSEPNTCAASLAISSRNLLKINIHWLDSTYAKVGSRMQNDSI